MSDLIKVPYTELFQRAARIRQEAETIRAEIDTLQQTVESVQWMGKRAERFFTLWNETIPEMERWVATLQGFAGSTERNSVRHNCPPRYSTCAPDAFTTAAHFGISLLMYAPNSSGVLALTSAPMS